MTKSDIIHALDLNSASMRAAASRIKEDQIEINRLQRERIQLSQEFQNLATQEA
jgi:hypothetical protein